MGFGVRAGAVPSLILPYLFRFAELPIERLDEGHELVRHGVHNLVTGLHKVGEGLPELLPGRLRGVVLQWLVQQGLDQLDQGLDELGPQGFGLESWGLGRGLRW